QALHFLEAALTGAQALNGTGHRLIGMISTDLGVVYSSLLGDFQTGLRCFERARSFASERNQTRNVALGDLDIACILKDQGQYRRALQLFSQARDIYQTEHLALDANHVNREIVGCYLQLNRHGEARDLAQHVIARYQALGEGYREALAQLDLATAEAEV